MGRILCLFGLHSYGEWGDMGRDFVPVLSVAFKGLTMKFRRYTRRCARCEYVQVKDCRI